MAREVALTNYIRFLIREWERSGKTLVDLEVAAGAKSSGHFSQIKSGKLGAGARVVGYMATALGKTPMQIRQEAENYAGKVEEEQKQLQGNVSDAGLSTAIRMIREVGATSNDAIANAMKRWSDRIGKGETWDWWVAKISDEEKALVGLHGREIKQRRRRSATAKQTRAKQAEFRDMKKRVERGEHLPRRDHASGETPKKR